MATDSRVKEEGERSLELDSAEWQQPETETETEPSVVVAVERKPVYIEPDVTVVAAYTIPGDRDFLYQWVIGSNGILYWSMPDRAVAKPLESMEEIADFFREFPEARDRLQEVLASINGGGGEHDEEVFWEDADFASYSDSAAGEEAPAPLEEWYTRVIGLFPWQRDACVNSENGLLDTYTEAWTRAGNRIQGHRCTWEASLHIATPFRPDVPKLVLITPDGYEFGLEDLNTYEY